MRGIQVTVFLTDEEYQVLNAEAYRQYAGDRYNQNLTDVRLLIQDAVTAKVEAIKARRVVCLG